VLSNNKGEWMEEGENMIKHIVFWKIKGEGQSAEKERVFQEFTKKTEYLKTIIPQIISAQVGLNKNPDGYHVCIDSIFQDMESLSVYIDHPEHLKVRKYMDAVTDGKTVFDYEM